MLHKQREVTYASAVSSRKKTCWRMGRDTFQKLMMDKEEILLQLVLLLLYRRRWRQEREQKKHPEA